MVRDRTILYQRRNHFQDWRDTLSRCTPFVASNVCRSGWHRARMLPRRVRADERSYHTKNVPRRWTTRSRIIFYEGIVSVLYISSLTTRCCLVVAVRCRCTSLYLVLHLSLLSVLPTMSTPFRHRPTFSFSHSVSVVLVSPNSLLSSSSKTFLSFQPLFFSSPRMFHLFMPSLFKQPEALPSVSLLHLRRSLEARRHFITSPITPEVTPRLPFAL